MTDTDLSDALIGVGILGAVVWVVGYAAIVYVGVDMWFVAPPLALLVLAFVGGWIADDEGDGGAPGPEDLDHD